MCGRFVLFASDEEIMAVPGFPVVYAPHGLPKARYNIAPTQIIPIIRTGDTPEEIVIEPARWGLIPGWKKDLSGAPLFNARSETLTHKPSFSHAFRTNRCAIPMSGYYEWKDKQPYWISTGDIVYAAGLFDTGLNRLTATMVTTDAIPPLDSVHHRMPRFLEPDELRIWLGEDTQAATQLLHPTSHEMVSTFTISPADPRVGNVKNDDPDLINNPALF
ncbi:MAG: SOS response-associated peptidase [Corynebacterium sp.]|uniref:SOS response-associated peptidase n=1 Tax=Corynebacterium sp. TaxID=1720 RepID=UPI0026DC280E|nr:SOS response-associated peptidase [Corynebacterium sp.]MDO4761237.1 SOS response-associated peptidase [Corynebacterium sp.]